MLQAACLPPRPRSPAARLPGTAAGTAARRPSLFGHAREVGVKSVVVAEGQRSRLQAAPALQGGRQLQVHRCAAWCCWRGGDAMQGSGCRPQAAGLLPTAAPRACSMAARCAAGRVVRCRSLPRPEASRATVVAR